MEKKIYIEFLFLVLLGMATSFSLPPFNYFVINFITFTLFFVFLIKKSNVQVDKKFFFIYGWLFGFGYFAVSLYWISISLTFDQSYKFLIPLTIFLIPAFLGIFYGFISFFFLIFKPRQILNSILTFSLIYGIFEFIRGIIFTGFPWNLISYSFINFPEILSITSIIGTYGFNLLCVSIFISPAILIVKVSKKNILTFIFFLLIPILFYVYGLSYEKKFNNVDKKTYDFTIRVVGSNINLDRFYYEIDPISVLKDLIEISNPDMNKKIIFVWPEGILPDISQEELNEYKWLFDKRFNKNHLFLIGINSNSLKDNDRKYFNSLSFYDSELNLLNFYNKIKLVPFGEFLPLENILRNIGLRNLTNNYQSFSKGNKRNIININIENFNLKILPLICYEIIYTGELFEDSNFDLIINISEDGWFGESIGPKQHFAHSIVRAIESGKYVLRSANNGVAAIVNPLGYVEQKVNFGESGYVDLTELKKIQPTVFSKYGNKIFVLLILLYIFLIISFNRIKNE